MADISKWYNPGQTIGKGAFGEVRACVNRTTNVPCAIKVIHKASVRQDAVVRELMAQEFATLEATKHPHIVRVIELLEGPVNYYVVMELVTGGDLCKHIVRKKHFSEQ